MPVDDPLAQSSVILAVDTSLSPTVAEVQERTADADRRRKGSDLSRDEDMLLTFGDRCSEFHDVFSVVHRVHNITNPSTSSVLNFRSSRCRQMSTSDSCFNDGSFTSATDDLVAITSFTWAVYNEVPEPSSLLLFGAGLIGLLGVNRRRRRLKQA